MTLAATPTRRRRTASMRAIPAAVWPWWTAGRASSRPARRFTRPLRRAAVTSLRVSTEAARHGWPMLTRPRFYYGECDRHRSYRSKVLARAGIREHRRLIALNVSAETAGAPSWLISDLS